MYLGNLGPPLGRLLLPSQTGRNVPETNIGALWLLQHHSEPICFLKLFVEISTNKQIKYQISRRYLKSQVIRFIIFIIGTFDIERSWFHVKVNLHNFLYLVSHHYIKHCLINQYDTCFDVNITSPQIQTDRLH